MSRKGGGITSPARFYTYAPAHSSSTRDSTNGTAAVPSALPPFHCSEKPATIRARPGDENRPPTSPVSLSFFISLSVSIWLPFSTRTSLPTLYRNSRRERTSPKENRTFIYSPSIDTLLVARETGFLVGFAGVRFPLLILSLSLSLSLLLSLSRALSLCLYV